MLDAECAAKFAAATLPALEVCHQLWLADGEPQATAFRRNAAIASCGSNWRFRPQADDPVAQKPSSKLCKQPSERRGRRNFPTPIAARSDGARLVAIWTPRFQGASTSPRQAAGSTAA